MRKFYSSIAWSTEISVFLLMSSVQIGRPSEQNMWQSFSGSEHEINPLTVDQMRHYSNDESASLNSALYHSHPDRKSGSRVLLQPEETANTDLNSHTALHGALQFGDTDLSVPVSEFPQSVKGRQHDRSHRRKKLKTSSTFIRSISPDITQFNGPHNAGRVFTNTEEKEQPGHSFEEFHDGNQHSGFPKMFRSPEDQPFLADSDNSETREFFYDSDFSSPTGRLDAESYPEHHSSRSEHHYGSENRHQRLQTRQVFSNQQQQRSSHHPSQNRNPHSEFLSDDSFLGDSDILGRQGIFHRLNSPFSVTADSDANSEHLPSSRSESYENEQSLAVPQTRALESDGLGPFSSKGRMNQEFVQYPEHSLRDEGASGWHQQHYDSRSPVSTAERDELPTSPDLLENFSERSSSFEDNLEQQEESEYPSLDTCSEDSHTFYNGVISPSSPLYEIEPFLPQNFNEIFLNELLQKFRPYEHPNVGNRNSICNHNLKLDDTYHANVRAMCPFEWEVAGYNSSRYPPYLMTARCSCQLSKPMYREWSVCKEKKGRIPVLWRTGCNNGKHVYREGWDEINVACIPEGYTLNPGETAPESGTFHKPSV